MSMASSAAARRSSLTLERTSQWVSSQDIPTDVVVEIGEARFPLHKYMLVSKSGLIRRKIMESDSPDLTRIDLSEVPGGAEVFEKAARFCYAVNFEITIHNVVALRCAAEYLEMTEKCCPGNLAGRTEDFLRKAALDSLPSAVVVLRSCESFLPLAEDLKIMQRCVDAVSAKACNEASFPTRSPPEWWAFELAALGPSSLQKTITAMRLRGAPAKTLATAVTAYAQKCLPDLLLSGSSPPSADTSAAALRSNQRLLVESLVPLLPTDAHFPIGFLCCLLRASIFLGASLASRKELEARIAAVLDLATVGDLLTVSLDYYGDRIADLDSLRRILAGFVEQERRGGLLYGGGDVSCSAAMQKVAKTVDAFVGEIATDGDLTVSKFAGIAGVIPKAARRFDDDLYRAVDIYLKAHPGLDEIEREKACSVMDPLKLSYEARLHTSQNKRLPVQIVLQAMYYDQLHLRGGVNWPRATDDTGSNRGRRRGDDDGGLKEENEALRSELVKMKMYLSELQRGGGQGISTSKLAAAAKGPGIFKSMSRTLGKLNPFRSGSKDTSSIEERRIEAPAKPRTRRFSLS